MQKIGVLGRASAALAVLAAAGLSAIPVSAQNPVERQVKPSRKDSGYVSPSIFAVAKSPNGRAAGAGKAAQRAAMKKRRIKAHRRHSRG